MEISYKDKPIVRCMSKKQPVCWINTGKIPFDESNLQIGKNEIDEAEERLMRFAPLIKKYFPETEKNQGLIESELEQVSTMQKYLEERYNIVIPGKLYLKKDSHLAVAGSVKARGGIYEILKHTEDLALEHNLLSKEDKFETKR